MTQSPSGIPGSQPPKTLGTILNEMTQYFPDQNMRSSLCAGIGSDLASSTLSRLDYIMQFPGHLTQPQILAMIACYEACQREFQASEYQSNSPNIQVIELKIQGLRKKLPQLPNTSQTVGTLLNTK